MDQFIRSSLNFGKWSQENHPIFAARQKLEMISIWIYWFFALLVFVLPVAFAIFAVTDCKIHKIPLIVLLSPLITLLFLVGAICLTPVYLSTLYAHMLSGLTFNDSLDKMRRSNCG